MKKIMTAREFNQAASSALKVAETEPVYITKRGQITNVILSYEQYQSLTPQPKRKTAAEYFCGSFALADIPDEVFNQPREIEDWNEKELFD
ncbi:hypothetical protein A1D22_00095 [Pasteurellaceae bacterium LFhippo2]|nr:hypothetical protein [Pasteurellaceae bacterium LFhippo2]